MNGTANRQTERLGAGSGRRSDATARISTASCGAGAAVKTCAAGGNGAAEGVRATSGAATRAATGAGA